MNEPSTNRYISMQVRPRNKREAEELAAHRQEAIRELLASLLSC